MATTETYWSSNEVANSKGLRTRKAVLDAAISQFAAVGRRGASVSSIAREAGLTPSAAYVYFPSKQALFEAAVDHDTAGLLADALPELLDGAFDGSFEQVFSRLIGAIPSHPLARRVLSGDEGKGAERLKQLPAELRFHLGLTEALRRRQEMGTFRRDLDPETFASGLEAIVVALLIAILQTGGEPDPTASRGVLSVLDAALYSGA